MSNKIDGFVNVTGEIGTLSKVTSMLQSRRKKKKKLVLVRIVNLEPWLRFQIGRLTVYDNSWTKCGSGTITILITTNS